VMYNVYFLISSFVFLAVVGKHDLRCFVINLYQPRLVEGLLQVVLNYFLLLRLNTYY
jgi:hypothetical protein